jgi:hypothetical protein
MRKERVRRDICRIYLESLRVDAFCDIWLLKAFNFEEKTTKLATFQHCPRSCVFLLNKEVGEAFTFLIEEKSFNKRAGCRGKNVKYLRRAQMRL